MIFLPSRTKVFIAPGATDLRKAIGTLSIMVESSLELNPFSGHLFVFCNRRRTTVKVLYWDRNGFCLWCKRLEKHRFRWPEDEGRVREIGPGELGFLLEGLDLGKVRGHGALSYSNVS